MTQKKLPFESIPGLESLSEYHQSVARGVDDILTGFGHRTSENWCVETNGIVSTFCGVCRGGWHTDDPHSFLLATPDDVLRGQCPGDRPVPPSPFEQAVAEGSEGLKFLSPGVCCECGTCRAYLGYHESGGIAEDPTFSHSPCHLCNSIFAGDRWIAHGRDEIDIVHLEICGDCLQYIANGTLPENWRSNPNSEEE